MSLQVAVGAADIDGGDMRAALYSRYGGPEAIALVDVPRPEPAAGEIRVRIAAAAVNPLDWKLLRGDLRVLRGRSWPKRIGIDFSGAVDAVGPGVPEWRVGEAVFGSLANPLAGTRGAFAEHVIVQPSEIVRKPTDVPFARAAALPIAGASALACLELGDVKPGADVLLIGGAGGVGSFCTAAAAPNGVRITAVCRSTNDAYVRQLGAADVIPHDQVDPRRTSARFDAVIDAVGAYSFRDAAELLKPRGVYVTTTPGPAHYVRAWCARLFGEKQARALVVKVTAAQLERLATLAASAHFRAVACETFPLERVSQALEQSRAGSARGKLVLEMARG